MLAYDNIVVSDIFLLFGLIFTSMVGWQEFCETEFCKVQFIEMNARRPLG
jgi:hypothetical protein